MTAARQRFLSSLRRGRRFGRDRQGIAATEFALLLPIMLVIFVGVTEVGQAISISRKVTITSRTVTDLVTQYSALSSTDMTSLLSAAAQVMAPYPSSKLTVTVSEVSTDSSNNATITWSSSLNGTAYATGQKVTLPSGLNLPNISVIWGQVQYAYTPVLGDNIIGTTMLSDQIYMNSRLCTAINYGSTVTTSTNTSSCPATSSSSTSTSSTSTTSTTSTSSTTTTSTSSTSTTTSSTCSWSSWWGCSWW